MSAIVPDSAIELTGFSVHRSDRTKELTGKSRGGGVCFYINNLWCDERNIHSIKSFCSPDLEFHTLLCRPFWLPREFTAIIITAVYIPPQANTDQALRELYRNISEQETAHPDAAFVITGDFNKANFRTIAPKYFHPAGGKEVGEQLLSLHQGGGSAAEYALPDISRWRRGWQPCCVLRENFAVFRMFYLFFCCFTC